MSIRTLFIAVLFAAPALADDKADWKPLFNGKNLDGWMPKITGYDYGDNFSATFRVEDGLLKVPFDKYDSFGKKFGHLFYKDKFSHYVIRVEYRFVGEQCKEGPGWAIRNSGIMFHCQDPRTMRKDREFPYRSRHAPRRQRHGSADDEQRLLARHKHRHGPEGSLRSTATRRSRRPSRRSMGRRGGRSERLRKGEACC